MSKLVIIFGPQAVGKMSVGKRLTKKTGVNFTMNYTTIDMILPFSLGVITFLKDLTLFLEVS